MPREDWGTLGKIRELPPLGTPPQEPYNIPSRDLSGVEVSFLSGSVCLFLSFVFGQCKAIGQTVACFI